METVLPPGRGRRMLTRGLAAMMAPALAALIGPAAASAATREVWVAAVPTTLNAVPNGHDAIHGTRFEPAETVFPTVVYRRYTKRWKKPLTLSYEPSAGVGGGIPGPLIR